MNTPIHDALNTLVEIHIATPAEYATLQLVADAESMMLDSPVMFAECGEQIISLTKLYRTIEEERVGMVAPINESHNRVMAFFKRHSDPVRQSLAIYKRKYAEYQAMQQRIADEAQRQANIAADAERRRLHAEAEAENERIKALAQSGASSDEIAESSAEAEAKIEELQTQAAMVVAPVVSAVPAKVAGISSRENWKYNVSDSSLIPREYLMLDDKKISGVVKAMKAETNILGIQPYAEMILATHTGI